MQWILKARVGEDVPHCLFYRIHEYPRTYGRHTGVGSYQRERKKKRSWHDGGGDPWSWASHTAMMSVHHDPLYRDPHLCPRGTKEQHACRPVGVAHMTDHHQWHKSVLNYESQKLAGCTPSPKAPSWAHGSLHLPTCFSVWLGLSEWVWPTNDSAMPLPSGPRAAA